jgi:hypothetical protein
MEVSDQLDDPAALPPYPLYYEAGWAPVMVLDAVAWRKISCPCRESNPGRPARNTSLNRPSCLKKRKAHILINVGSRDSAVGIATGYGLDGQVLEFESR